MPSSPVLALGVFDGVHAGHREIIRNAVELAGLLAGVPVAVPFFPHPKWVLNGVSPELLLPPEERKKELLKAGAKHVLPLNFSRELAELTPAEFLNQLIAESRPVGIVVGEHWRFGRRGAGDRVFLNDYCKERGIAIRTPRELEMDGNVVSSSLIRQSIAAGDFRRAIMMSGRPVRLYGYVGHGFEVARRELNAPTANIITEYGVLPPNGVYAGTLLLPDGAERPAIFNCGISPTFTRPDAGRRLEAHVLDFCGDLYGAKVRAEFRAFLRPEKRFASVEELKRQIAADLAEARRMVKA